MDLSSLEQRLEAIENRLSKIEQTLAVNPQSTLPDTPAIPQSSLTSTQAVSTSPAFFKTNSGQKSGNWLGIIGIICFIFAAGFIIKLSIESGWLTPQRQIVIAALFGFALIIAGFILLTADREYASLLPAAGIIILYLTVFAAQLYYHLISFYSALGITTLISALCLWLYFRIRHDLYAIIAAVGVYLSPVISDINTSAVFSLYYFLICSLTFATISIWVRSRLLTVIAAYLAIVINMIIGIGLNQDLLIAIVLAVHFLIFTIGTYLYTSHTRQSLSETEAWSFFPVLLIFYAAEYYFIERIQPGLAPWISLGFAGLIIVLYLSAKKWFPQGGIHSHAMIFAFITIIAFHSIYLEILPDELKPWLFVLIAGLTAVFRHKYTLPAKKSAYIIPGTAIFAVLGIEYISMLAHLIDVYNLNWLLVSFAAFISLWLMLLLPVKNTSEKEDFSYGLLAAAHLLGVTALYRLTIDYGSLAVSASWLFYAICVLTLAYSRQDKTMAKSALFVLAFAAGKALLYDASSTPTIIRILCLLLTGAVLYGSGFMMRKIGEWKQ